MVDFPAIDPVQTSQTQEKKQSIWIEIFDISLEIFIIVLIFVIIKTFFVSAFKISGSSMEPTFHDGELILIDKLNYSRFLGSNHGDPIRGDVIVFRPPTELNRFYIKRIIGLPGDTVQFRNNAITIVNKDHPQGFLLSEDYLNCDVKTATSFQSNCSYRNVEGKSFTVPDNEYFAMGDNRDFSKDSRVCFESCSLANATAFVERDAVVGKAWVVLWPFSQIRMNQVKVYE